MAARLHATLVAGLVLSGLVAAVATLGCGSRSTLLYRDEAGADPVEACETDEDCSSDLCRFRACLEGACRVLSEVTCDDADPCTEEACVPENGLCDVRRRTEDADQDGFFAPLPGFAAGSEGACGDDCNDQNPNVHPGAPEGCDAVDNDCNGAIDDGALYSPVGGEPLRLSSDSRSASAGGVAFGGESYGVTLTSQTDRWHNLFQLVSAEGSLVGESEPVVNVNSSTFAGPLIFAGESYATVWADARQAGNYEVYFNRLDSGGNKLGPDLRVTRADDFSLRPDLVFTGSEFVVVWDDRRASGATDTSSIFGQRIGADGELVGNAVRLSAGATDESPEIALGTARLGIVYTRLDDQGARALFTTTKLDLSDATAPLDVGAQAALNPSIVWVADRFVVTYTKYDVGPRDALYALAVTQEGELVVPETRLSFGARFARSQDALSLGDRLVVAWAEDRGESYELFAAVLDASLSPSPAGSSPARLTFDPADTLSPVLSLGPGGDVAVAFDDWRSGSRQAYFTRLSCSGR